MTRKTEESMVSRDMIEAVVEGHNAEEIIHNALLEAGNKVHTAWKWIPKKWQEMFTKKKVKLKGGQDETVTMHPDYGEVSVGKGMFKMKTIEVGKPEIAAFIRSLKPAQSW